MYKWTSCMCGVYWHFAVECLETCFRLNWSRFQWTMSKFHSIGYEWKIDTRYRINPLRKHKLRNINQKSEQWWREKASNSKFNHSSILFGKKKKKSLFNSFLFFSGLNRKSNKHKINGNQFVIIFHVKQFLQQNKNDIRKIEMPQIKIKPFGNIKLIFI